MSELGELLRELRGKRSLREIAKITEISHTYISDLEKGFRRDTKAPINPSPDTLKRLANAYDFSYEELMKSAGYLPDLIVNDGNNEYHVEVKSADKDDKYDSLSEINKLIKEYGIEQMGFFDIEQWKNLSPQDVKIVEEHFKMIVKLAKERNQEK
ncbi:helix-turn-helix domain-containing protein [Niallia taxi]|uniref:Helix-turn-helix domain-containing protein n=1 Tax=Niallia taxi TaxID=2499688 RepID=A0A437KHS5_9BACI|nr:helix-turn-helix transcriptional regulator [Niallia taxi]RVT67689.1 helix-turn-helix domain-containing protein [Niallia taxi]